MSDATLPTRIPLERPLTWQELRDLTDDGKRYLEAVVQPCLDDLIREDMEWLNDAVNSTCLPEDYIAGLMDFSYNVIGYVSGDEPVSWGAGAVLIHVRADASEAIREHKEESEL